MSLTDVIYYIRKFIPVFFIGFFFFILFFFLISFLFSFLSSQKKMPILTTATINPCFGKLKQLQVNPAIKYPSDAEFILDTIEGQPTTATASAAVLFFPKKLTRFGYLQKINLMAKTLDFNTEVTQHTLKDSTATFDDGAMRFSVDVATFNFDFESDYRKLPELFIGSQIPEQTEIIEAAKEFLRTMDVYNEELSRGKENLIYLHYDPTADEFEVVTDPNQANTVEVDFFRPDIGSLPMVAPKYFNSQNFVTLVFRDGRYKVLKAQVNFFESQSQKDCLYPVKTGDQAWDELKQKQGFIISAGEGKTRIAIKKMFLGYYDPLDYQEYLQPVYVFLGDNGFVGLVPAVREGYIE